jgi:bifunctional non-homologous end joining protein LigD
MASAFSNGPRFSPEVCALDEAGVPRFQLIQPRINLTRTADIASADSKIPVVYFAFDLLYLDGHDLRAVPLRERRALLESSLGTDGLLRLIAQVPEDGVSLFESAGSFGFEGVVGKRVESRYETGARSHSWLKVKTERRQEFVIGGYTPGEGARRSSFGAVAVGYYEDDAAGSGRVLRYAGNVGSGFDDAELTDIGATLRSLEIDACPFQAPSGGLDGAIEGKVTWVEPRLIAEVKFLEWTKDGRLRAPVFVGLRDDLAPAEVGLEQAQSVEAVAAPDETTEPTPDDDLGPEDDKAMSSAAAVPTARPEESKRTREATPSRQSNSNAGTSIERDAADVLAQLEGPRTNFVAQVQSETLKLSNLDKVFWPAFGEAPPLTKRDLIRYYVELAPVLLPHLKDRPLTLTRYPNGVEGTLFYQKHYAQPIPGFVATVPIYSSHNAEDGTYIMCNNLPTLVWLAQIADLELHAWMSRVDPEPDAAVVERNFAGSREALDASVLDYPDYMVFDLDPYIYSGSEAKGAEPEFNHRGWEKTVELALALKELLDQMSLSSYVKTSGKTGLHVYVPILRHQDYDWIRAFTRTLGLFLVQQHPKDVTMEWDTSKRTGKVFFDHNQNTRGKTLAAQYSLRPTPWAGASTPVTWSELPSIDPTSFNLRTLPARVAERGDPWWDVLERKADLDALLGS